MVTCEAIWIWKLLVALFGQKIETVVIHCNNQSCIKLSENPVFHDRSKHIDHSSENRGDLCDSHDSIQAKQFFVNR